MTVSRRIALLESEISELKGALGEVLDKLRRMEHEPPLTLDDLQVRRHYRGLSAQKRTLQQRKNKRLARAKAAALRAATPTAPSPAPTHGLGAALARGEGAKVEWIRAGEIVSAKTLADRWGLTPQALGPAAKRGELFAVVVSRERYYPSEFLELDRDDVSAVCMALGPLSAGEKLVFWKRPHGALGGKPVFELLRGKTGDGSQVARVVQLARARAAQAEANAAAVA